MKKSKKHKVKESVLTSAVVPQNSSKPQPTNMTKEEALALVTRKMHPDILGALGYGKLAKSMGMTGEHLEAAYQAPIYLQEEVRAKNGIERMALGQMMLAQGRASWLSELATKQTQPKALAVVLEACERASATYVRLMRAFQECRQPRNTGTTVSIGVGQANLAAQQLVQNIREQSVQKKSDEQTRMKKEGEVIDVEVVPAVETGITLTEGRDSKKQTVGKEHGAKDSRRKSHSRNELTRARRKVRHRR